MVRLEIRKTSHSLIIKITLSFVHFVPGLAKSFQQLELNLERLWLAADDLLVKLGTLFQKPKQQTVFVVNNYDMTISVLKVNSVLKLNMTRS